MRKKIPYGFAIYPQMSLFKLSYDIVDLANDKKMFTVKKEGSMRSNIHIYDYEGQEIIRAKKPSFWKNKYLIEKKGFHIATLFFTNSLCNNRIYIDTDSERFIGTRIRGRSYQFLDLEGNLVFHYERNDSLFHNEYLLEVYDSIQPEIAILSSIIIDIVFRGQRTAMIAASSS